MANRMFIRVTGACGTRYAVNADMVRYAEEDSDGKAELAIVGESHALIVQEPFDSICSTLSAADPATPPKTSGPIEDLDVSVRTSNCLRRAGVDTIGKAISAFMDRRAVVSIRNLGRKSAYEVYEALWDGGYLERQINPFGLDSSPKEGR
ncbi:MAG: DNA-directed RNA polymerase subunit alpha C-terminal domain-containing protein [Sphaerochaetaceae bacterium]